MTRDDQSAIGLLLDEMHAPVVAATLRQRGHDVAAVADDPDLRAMSDEELFKYAAGHGTCIVTENIKEFRPVLRRAEEAGEPTAGLLLTSSRTFRRSRRNPGPIIDALEAWLTGPDARHRPTEDWLSRADK